MEWRVENYELWNSLTFKTLGYGRNYDVIDDNDRFVSEYEGVITEIGMGDGKPPLVIGEYALSVWNFKLAEKHDVDLMSVLKKNKTQNAYGETLSAIKDYHMNLYDYEKIVFIHSLIVHPKYRKRGVTQEFTEYLYRNFFNENTKILALVKPLQENEVEYDYYFKQKNVKFRECVSKGSSYRILPATQYYDLNKLLDKKDLEINKYKLFSVAARCGFKRIGESHLFKFNPEMVVERIEKKNTTIKK
jgi:ribosomal protein S18 acetylase RimI-like enzyme